MFTPILLYHSISDQASEKFLPWAVPPHLFEEQLAYLSDAGYQSYTVTEYASMIREGIFDSLSKVVVITFDDGFADFYHTAAPVLIKYGMKATVYISTRYVGNTSQWLEPVGEGSRPMMNWDQIRAVYASGFECGAHAHQHLQLDILPGWRAWQEILECKARVEEQLNQPIFSFAYPHGYSSSSIREMVQQAGFSSACAVRNLISSYQDDLFALARLVIHPDISLPAFQLLLQGKLQEFIPYREGIKIKAWREVRRVSARFNLRLGM